MDYDTMMRHVQELMEFKRRYEPFLREMATTAATFTEQDASDDEPAAVNPASVGEAVPNPAAASSEDGDDILVVVENDAGIAAEDRGEARGAAPAAPGRRVTGTMTGTMSGTMVDAESTDVPTSGGGGVSSQVLPHADAARGRR